MRDVPKSDVLVTKCGMNMFKNRPKLNRMLGKNKVVPSEWKPLIIIQSRPGRASVCTRVMWMDAFCRFNYIYCSRYLFIVLCFATVRFNDYRETTGAFKLGRTWMQMSSFAYGIELSEKTQSIFRRSRMKTSLMLCKRSWEEFTCS